MTKKEDIQPIRTTPPGSRGFFHYRLPRWCYISGVLAFDVALFLLIGCIIFMFFFMDESPKSSSRKKAAAVSLSTGDVPKLTGRIVDLAKVLTEREKKAVNQEIKALETDSKGGQMAVLTIPSLADGTIEEYALKVAETWKIGRKGKDDGALLVLDIGGRKSRLEIGYGWEGAVNDAKAGDILRKMVPQLKKKQYGKAIISAVRAVRSAVSGNVLPEKVPEDDTSTAWTLILIMLALVAYGIVSIIIGGVLNEDDDFMIPPWTCAPLLIVWRLIMFVQSNSSGSSSDSSSGGSSSGSSGGGGGSFGGGGASGKW